MSLLTSLLAPGNATSVLDEVRYNPGSTTTLSTTSTTSADVDATNLAVSFDAPANGEVIVTYEAFCNATDFITYVWNIRDGSGDVAGTDRIVTNDGKGARITATIKVTGLTPLQTYAWKWGHRVGTDTNTGRIVCGSPYGPARMTVGKA